MNVWRGAVTAVIATMAMTFVAGMMPAHASPQSAVTVVLVHGAWADTSSWDGEITALPASNVHLGSDDPQHDRRMADHPVVGVHQHR